MAYAALRLQPRFIQSSNKFATIRVKTWLKRNNANVERFRPVRSDMKSHSVLGIDLGTSSVKALVVNRDDGRTVGDASAAYAIDRPEPGAAEQSPETWWRATVEAVRQALLQAGHPPIDAIGISGQMHGTVALDESLRPLGAAVIWADQRSAEDAASIEGVLGASLLERAGSRAAVGFQAATLRCLARTQPDRFEAIRMVLPPKDFLRLTMTGEIATDPSDAAGTLLFDLHTRAWSAELAAAAGIDLACLPPIVPSGAISGHLTPDAAHALGLLPCIPVAGGAADAPAAALGVGVIAPDSLLVTFSSGAQVYTPLASPVIDRTGRTHTFASPLDPATMAGWYGMGATLNAGNAVHWFQSLFSETDAARVAEMAESVPPGANGLLFLPYLAGERTPYFDADARGAFIGFNPTHGRPELARAVLEGIGFALLDAWEALREST